MSYTVYAKLSDGRILRYGKKLNTIAEANSAMAEMRADLKEAGLAAKVSYTNDAPKKSAGPDPLDGNLKEAVARGKGQYASKLAEKIRPNVTIRQVIDSINKDGDTFKLVTGVSLNVNRNSRGASWSRLDEMLIDAVCVAVAHPLKRRAHDVKYEWNYLGDLGNKMKFGKGEKKPLTVKEKEKVVVNPSELPKIGDIFTTYGNVHSFYIVTERKGTVMYRLVKIGSKVVRNIDGYGQVVMVVPDPTQKYPDRGNEWKKYNAKDKCFKIHSGWYGSVHLWDGQPVENDYLD